LHRERIRDPRVSAKKLCFRRPENFCALTKNGWIIEICRDKKKLSIFGLSSITLSWSSFLSAPHATLYATCENIDLWARDSNRSICHRRADCSPFIARSPFFHGRVRTSMYHVSSKNYAQLAQIAPRSRIGTSISDDAIATAVRGLIDRTHESDLFFLFLL